MPNETYGEMARVKMPCMQYSNMIKEEARKARRENVGQVKGSNWPEKVGNIFETSATVLFLQKDWASLRRIMRSIMRFRYPSGFISTKVSGGPEKGTLASMFMPCALKCMNDESTDSRHTTPPRPRPVRGDDQIPDPVVRPREPPVPPPAPAAAALPEPPAAPRSELPMPRVSGQAEHPGQPGTTAKAGPARPPASLVAANERRSQPGVATEPEVAGDVEMEEPSGVEMENVAKVADPNDMDFSLYPPQPRGIYRKTRDAACEAVTNWIMEISEIHETLTGRRRRHPTWSNVLEYQEVRDRVQTSPCMRDVRSTGESCLEVFGQRH